MLSGLTAFKHKDKTDQLTQKRRQADEVCEVAPTPAEEEKQEEGKQVAPGQRLLAGHRPEHTPPDNPQDNDKKRGTDSAMGRTQKGGLETLQPVWVVGQRVVVEENRFEAVGAALLAAVTSAWSFGSFFGVVLDFNVAILLFGGTHDELSDGCRQETVWINSLCVP